jgi:hypothetical protein
VSDGTLKKLDGGPVTQLVQGFVVIEMCHEYDVLGF